MEGEGKLTEEDESAAAESSLFSSTPYLHELRDQ
jgi:hypothetical protein